jgi:hypothetical protein
MDQARPLSWHFFRRVLGAWVEYPEVLVSARWRTFLVLFSVVTLSGCDGDAQRLERLHLRVSLTKYNYLAFARSVDSILAMYQIDTTALHRLRTTADSWKTQWTLAERDLTRFRRGH